MTWPAKPGRRPPSRHRRRRERLPRRLHRSPRRGLRTRAGSDPVAAWPLLRASVPRLVLNSAGPISGFWLGNHLAGVVGGVLVATAVSLSLFLWERLSGRPGRLVRLSLAIVFLQVLAGLWSGSAVAYFLPSIMVDLVEGSAFLLSSRTRWPLAAVIAAEVVTLPPDGSWSPQLRRPLVRLSLLWGSYFTLRGAVSGTVLLTASTHTYLLTRSMLDAPLVLLLAAVSVHYGLRYLRSTAPRAAGRFADLPAAQEIPG